MRARCRSAAGASKPPSPSAKRLLLLRHGRTAWNDTGRAQGHADVPLDDTGRAEAHTVAPALARLGLATIWSSDLARARETAEIIGGLAGVPVKPDERLREYDVGERQGLTVTETAERFPHLGAGWELGNPPAGVPGAESYDEVAARMVPALTEALGALQPGETGLVVTHGACAKTAIAALLGWPAQAATTLRSLGNCHLATLEQRAGEGCIRLRDYGWSPISHP